MLSKGKELSAQRKKLVPQLNKAVVKQLNALGFKQSHFDARRPRWRSKDFERERHPPVWTKSNFNLRPIPASRRGFAVDCFFRRTCARYARAENRSGGRR